MATQHSPPASQALSQFRNTLPPAPPAPVSMLGSPCPATPSQAPTYLATPRQSPRLTQYASMRVYPSQAPSPRVDSRVSPRHVASPRDNSTTPQHTITPLTPHPTTLNAPYAPQGMSDENLFNTFEEEHMETPSLLRYSTRAGARQHSAHSVQHQAPRVFHPITFTNTHVYHIALRHASSPIPMANAVINQDTGASL
jgi:hypothetical protein